MSDKKEQGPPLFPYHSSLITHHFLLPFASQPRACQTLLKQMPDSVALLQTMPRVLIADDQPAVIEALRLLLKGEGFETRAVASPTDAAEALSRQSFDVALIDLKDRKSTRLNS